MERIAEFKYHVLESDSKKHIVSNFNIEKTYNKLVFYVSYEPKFEYDEARCLNMMKKAIAAADYGVDFSDAELRKNIPLSNHIAWSIDSPIAFLGTKHKHNPNQILEISNAGSTYGFSKSPIYEGTWSITASLTAILTEYVDITIIVEGDEDNEEVD